MRSDGVAVAATTSPAATGSVCARSVETGDVCGEVAIDASQHVCVGFMCLYAARRQLVDVKKLKTQTDLGERCRQS